MLLPTPDVDIDPRDPSWVGAWWIGFIIIAVVMMIWTFPVLLFPPRLPGQTGGVKDTNMKELAKGNIPCSCQLYMLTKKSLECSHQNEPHLFFDFESF